jgi:hypothetical protein
MRCDGKYDMIDTVLYLWTRVNHRLSMRYWSVIGAAVTSPVTVCASDEKDHNPFIHLVAFVSFLLLFRTDAIRLRFSRSL